MKGIKYAPFWLFIAVDIPQSSIIQQLRWPQSALAQAVMQKRKEFIVHSPGISFFLPVACAMKRSESTSASVDMRSTCGPSYA